MDEVEREIVAEGFEPFTARFRVPSSGALLGLIVGATEDGKISGEKIEAFVASHLVSWDLDFPADAESVKALDTEILIALGAALRGIGEAEKN